MIFASTDKEWLWPPSKIHIFESAGNSFEPPQRAEINLFIAILFLGILCNADQNFTKKVNITGLGWIVKAKYIIDRKKKSQSISHGGSSTQCDEFLSLCGYAERIQAPKFPRTNNSRECSLVDKIVKWHFLLKGKQTNKIQNAIIYSVLISWWVLSGQVIALSIIY